MKIITLILSFSIISSVAYGVNANKLTKCQDDNCKSTHSAGVIIPPVSYITAWL